MFKRYECGCIGFVVNGMGPKPGSKRIYCFKACDEEGGRALGLFRRDTLQKKPSRKLADAEVEALFEDLANLICDGHALQHLRSALAVAGIGGGDAEVSS